MSPIEDISVNHQGQLFNQFEGLSPADLIEEERQSVVNLALAVLHEKSQAGEKITNVDDTRNYFRLKLAENKNEVFAALFLTNKHTIIAYEELFQGTIDGTSVYTRVVAQRSLELNAAAVIFVHNHPSGDPQPSKSDNEITQKLIESLKLLDIRVLDHVIVGTEGTVSFAERGLI